MTPDQLDAYIAAASAALDLPVAQEWRDAVRANLAVTLRFARLVDDFPLPDEAEPADLFRA